MRKKQDGQLKEFLSETFNRIMERDDGPDFGAAKARYLVESFLGSASDVQFYDRKDGKIDALRILDDETENPIIEVFQITGPAREKFEADDALATQRKDKFDADLVGLSENLKAPSSSGASEGAVTALRKIKRLLESKRRPFLNLNILCLYRLTEATKDTVRSRAEELLTPFLERPEQLTVTLQDVQDYAQGLGDYNPIHGVTHARFDLFHPESEPHKAPGAWLAFVTAESLVRAHDRYGTGLVHLNVRGYMSPKKGSANANIRASITDEKAAAMFHRMNNGIVITGRSVDLINGCVQVTKPNVVNGLQTVVTLWQYWEGAGPEERDRLKTIPVPIKVVFVDQALDETNDSLGEIASKVAIASNTQSPVVGRDLRANDETNISAQRGFGAREPSWFYERKNNEWTTLNAKKDLNHKNPYLRGLTSRLRAKDFYFGNRLRKLDGDKLVAYLLSSWGSLRESSSSAQHFTDAVFPLVMQFEPTEDGWVTFRDAAAPAGTMAQLAKACDHTRFQPKSQAPPLNRWLLIYLLGEALERLQLTEAPRKKLLPQWQKARSLQASIRADTWEEWAANVPEKSRLHKLYECEWILNSMRRPALWLTAQTLCRRYGDLSDDTCRKLLKLPQFSALADGDRTASVTDLADARFAPLGDPKTPLYTLFQLLRAGCAMVYADHSVELKTIESRQQVLPNPNNEWITRLRSSVVDIDSNIPDNTDQFPVGSRSIHEGVTDLMNALPDLED